MSQTWFITTNTNWGPSTFSHFPAYLVSEPNPNLGVLPVMVTSDPARDLGIVVGGSFSDAEVEIAKGRIRRQLMSEITNEYATLNRDLLRELAR